MPPYNVRKNLNMEEIFIIYEKNMRLGSVPYDLANIGFFTNRDDAVVWLNNNGFKETEIRGTFMDAKMEKRLTVNKVKIHQEEE